MVKFKNIWKDPVGSKIISTVILALLGLGWTFFPVLWTYLNAFFSVSVHFLFTKTAIYNIFLIILGFISLISVLLFIIKKNSNDQNDYRKHYTADVFDNLKWRWRYYLGSLHSSDIDPFCLKCDYEISPQKENMRDKWFYECSECENGSSEVFNEPIARTQDRIRRKIEKNIRNGSWKNRK